MVDEEGTTQKEQIEEVTQEIDSDDWGDVEVPDDLEEVTEEEDNSDIEEYMDEESEKEPKEEEKPSENTAEKEDSPEKEDRKEKPEEELHEVTQDGEKVKVSLQELKNAYSGGKQVEKRLGELDKEKKEFYAEKSQVEGYIAGFAEKVKDGNILGGLGYFGEFAGFPGHVLKEQLIASLMPEIQARSVMSAEELTNHKLKAENEYLAQKNESDTKRNAQRQAQEAEQAQKRELESTINGLKEAHKLTEQEWDLAFTELDSTLPKEEVITPDMVAEKASQLRIETQTTQKVQRVIRDYENEINDEFVAELKKVALEHPTLSDGQIKQLIEDSIKLHRKQELEANLNKKAGKKTKSPKSSDYADEESNEYDLSEYIGDDGW